MLGVIIENDTLPHLVRGRPNRWRPFALNRRAIGGGGDMRLSSWKTDGGGGGFENWRSKEGKEGRKSARLESIFRVGLD